MYLTTIPGPRVSAVPGFCPGVSRSSSSSIVRSPRSAPSAPVRSNLLMAGRAVRVRSASVDAHLLNALGVQPAQGRLFTREDSLVSAPPRPGGGAVTAPVALDFVRALAVRVRRARSGGGARRRRRPAPRGRRRDGARRRSHGQPHRRSGCRSVSRTPNARRATTTTCTSSDG